MSNIIAKYSPTPHSLAPGRAGTTSIQIRLAPCLLLLSLLSINSSSLAQACSNDEFESESGNCYPVWHGELASGGFYTIVKPEGWVEADGLVIWNHGFQSFLTGFESTDLLSLLNPFWEGYYTGSVQDEPGLGPYADVLLADGYAMAASSYSQTGWAVFDSHIGNAELYQQFLSLAAADGLDAPQQFFIVGGSLGGIVTMRDLEAGLLPQPDGALILCGAVAGSVNWVEAYDQRVIYEAVCESVPDAELPQPWYERPELLFGEVAFLDSLDRCTGISSRLLIDENDPLEVFAWELNNADEAERLEEILETAEVENIYFLGLNLWYAVFQIPRLIQDETQLNGLIPFSNLGIDYGDGSVNQAARRSIALPSALQTLVDNYTPSGEIGDTRIVSIHTSHDGLVRVQNQMALIDSVPANQLTVGIVDDSDSPSHCGFSVDEGLAAWDELSAWVNGGVQPSPLDLQLRCLSNAGDEDDCNYDPSLLVTTALPTFKRDLETAVTGNNSYDNASGELSFENLRLLGDNTRYQGVLAPPAPGGSLFTVGSLETTGSDPVWQHGAAYDPNQSLLYLPEVSVENISPVDRDRYDVYMRLDSEDGVDGLRFLELEVEQ